MEEGAVQARRHLAVQAGSAGAEGDAAAGVFAGAVQIRVARSVVGYVGEARGREGGHIQAL